MRKIFIITWDILSTILAFGALGMVLYFIYTFFETLYSIVVKLGWI